MADGETLALLEHIRDIGERTENKLDQHIARDEKTNNDFLLPLWNAYQRRIGARAVAVAFYSVISGSVALAVSWFHK
jgi:hypothetical protein